MQVYKEKTDLTVPLVVTVVSLFAIIMLYCVRAEHKYDIENVSITDSTCDP